MTARETAPLFKNVDRGWAWVIAVSGCLVHVVVGGHRRSMGLFFNEFIEYYGSSTSETASIISVFYVLSLVTAPLATSLSKRTSMRLVVALGGIAIAAGFVISAFVKNLQVTIFTVGALSGLGNSFLHVPVLILIGQYFDKHRTLAVGITLAGAALGSFVFPPLISITAEVYGFPAMMLCVAGLSLQTVVFAMLLRSPEKITEELKIDMNVNHSSEVGAGEIRVFSESDIVKDDEILPLKESLKAVYEVELDNQSDIVASSDRDQSNNVISTENAGQDTDEVEIHRLTKANPVSKLCIWLKSPVVRMPSFYLFALACAVATEMLPMSFYIIPPLCRDFGIGIERQSLILLLMGLPDLIARVGIGYVADRCPSWKVDMFVGFVLLKGFLWLFVSSWTDFVSITVFGMLAGTIGGCIFTLYLPLLVDAVGLKNLDKIFPFSLVLEGIFCLILPLLLAFVAEITGSWIASCRIMIGVSLFAGALVVYKCKIFRICCKRKNHG